MTNPATTASATPDAPTVPAAPAWARSGWTRQSYEAEVLLVPLDPRARAHLGDLPTGTLDGITVAPEALLAPDPPAEHTDTSGTFTDTGTSGRSTDTTGPSGALAAAVGRADVLTLLADDLAAVDTGAVDRVGRAARACGTLLGAVVVRPGLDWHGAGAHHAATVLRENADTVLVVRDTDPFAAYLQVLRGGTRAPRAAGAAGPEGNPVHD